MRKRKKGGGRVVSFWLDGETLEQLEALVHYRHQSASSLIRTLIRVGYRSIAGVVGGEDLLEDELGEGVFRALRKQRERAEQVRREWPGDMVAVKP